MYTYSRLVLMTWQHGLVEMCKSGLVGRLTRVYMYMYMYV